MRAYPIALVVLLTTACTTPQKSPDPDELTRQFKQTIAQDYLISREVKCLPHRLTKTQEDYLLHSSREVEQKYLALMITDDACYTRAVRSCETLYPGMCIAH